MIRVGVVGASGRSGSLVVEALSERAGVSLHAAVVSEQSTKLGLQVRETDVCYTAALESLIGADVVIEFSKPEASVLVAQWCAERDVPLLVATTGHSPEQLNEVRKCGSQTAIGITPNTSLGAATLISLAKMAKGILGEDFDIEVLDLHHRMKRDAPSGTAKAIVEPLAEGKGVIFGREGLRSSGEIGVVSIRGGDVAGEHTVYFLGDGERIEISHRVSSRAIFGRGAVAMAIALKGLPAGVYSAPQLLTA
jgi:4-hydroxy-tetrahydrodipicolinate reductase